MEQVLSVLRWIIHKLAIVLLGLLVWSYVPLLAFTTNVTDSNQVKSWFVEGEVYKNTVDQSVALADSKSRDNILKEEFAGSAINLKELVKALQPAIPAEFVQAQVEGTIDGFYAWLNGETAQPEFSLSLAGQADEIEKLLAPEITRQLSKLPACTSPDQINQLKFDPKEATCIPPGYAIDPEAKKYAKDFVSKADGPIQAEFTGEDLGLSYEALLNVPTAFSSLKLTPMFFWLFLLGFSAITVLTARRWQRGLKEIGLTLGIGGAILLLVSFITSSLASTPGKYFLDSQDQDVKDEAIRIILEPLAKVITADISQTSMIFSAIVMAIGLAAYLIGWHFGKSKVDGEEKPKDRASKKDEVPELMRDDDGPGNFIDTVHNEKSQKPKLKEKIKKKLIQ